MLTRPYFNQPNSNSNRYNFFGKEYLKGKSSWTGKITTDYLEWALQDNNLLHGIAQPSRYGEMLKYTLRYRNGVYDSPKTLSLINELGAEGIVTPQGTITALPSHTGIVPADLTRNLFQLGEVAPNLIRGLSSIKTEANRFNSTEDNSMHVNDLNITVNADSDFNFNKLLSEARQYMAITRHNNK